MVFSRFRVGKEGFTLIEVVSAVFIFLLGIVGVLSLFASATMLHKGARDKTMAALVIQEVLTDIEGKLQSGELSKGDGTLFPLVEEEVLGHERYRYEARFEPIGEAEGGMVLAHIALTWKEKGKVRGETFEYIFRSGPAFHASVASFMAEAESAEKPDGEDSEEP
jgi:Tfp pilus assembly protein PilE